MSTENRRSAGTAFAVWDGRVIVTPGFQPSIWRIAPAILLSCDPESELSFRSGLIPVNLEILVTYSFELFSKGGAYLKMASRIERDE
jgi:hypothetical protein